MIHYKVHADKVPLVMFLTTWLIGCTIALVEGWPVMEGCLGKCWHWFPELQRSFATEICSFVFNPFEPFFRALLTLDVRAWHRETEAYPSSGWSAEGLEAGL